MTATGSIFSLDTMYNICFGVGFLFLLFKIGHYVKLIWSEIHSPEKNLARRYGENSYAVITGASDGIGKALAIGLAKRKFNLVLIARNEAKLKDVEKEIKEVRSDTQTKIVVADFSESYKEGFFTRIMEQLNDLDISILINNVGTAHTHFLTKLSEEQIKETIYVNCIPQAVLTRHFVEKFVKREKKCAVVSISSLAGVYPTPLFQTYGASKAFGDYLSNTVSMEYPQIDVLSIRPGYVQTKMNRTNTNKFFPVTAEACAKAVFKRMGYVNTSYGHWKHIFVGEGGEIVPTFIRNAISNWILRSSKKKSKAKKQQ